MRLQFFSDAGIEKFKLRFANNLEYYKKADNSWFLEQFSQEGVLGTYNMDFPDIELICDKKNPKETDFANVKIMFDALKNLNPSDATQEKIWAALAHTTFWNYIKYRKSSDFNSDKVRKIENNFFFLRSLRRSIFIHPLARLWWTGFLTYDEKVSDHYHLTKMFADTSSFASNIILLSSNNFLSNKKIMLGFLKGIERAAAEGIRIHEQQARYQYVMAAKYFNQLGAVCLLDSLEEEEIASKVYEYLLKHKLSE